MFPEKRYTCVVICQLEKLLNFNLPSSSSRMVFPSRRDRRNKRERESYNLKVSDETIRLL